MKSNWKIILKRINQTLIKLLIAECCTIQVKSIQSFLWVYIHSMKEIHFRFMILFDVMHKIAHNSNNECSELNWKHVNWCENEKLSTIFALIFAHWNSSELRNEWFYWQFCVLTFCSLTLFWKITVERTIWMMLLYWLRIMLIWYIGYYRNEIHGKI